MSFEIIHKPTFTNQLLTIPKERVVQVLEKIEVLRKDPKPHGSLKKKLHGYEGAVYRLRSGDYRIIYTYGDGWVSLLGVDSRKDVYRGTKLYAEEATIDIKKVSNLELLLLPHLPSQPLPSPLPPVLLIPFPLSLSLRAALPLTTSLLTLLPALFLLPRRNSYCNCIRVCGESDTNSRRGDKTIPQNHPPSSLFFFLFFLTF